MGVMECQVSACPGTFGSSATMLPPNPLGAYTRPDDVVIRSPGANPPTPFSAIVVMLVAGVPVSISDAWLSCALLVPDPYEVMTGTIGLPNGSVAESDIDAIGRLPGPGVVPGA